MNVRGRVWRAVLFAVLLGAHVPTTLAWPLDGDGQGRPPIADGQILWLANGVGFCTADGDQGIPHLAPDGAGGMIAVWTDARSTANGVDIYAQRLNAVGTPLWAANGVVVSDAPNNQLEPQAISDGAGGVLVAWDDERPGGLAIFAQRLDDTGKTLWAADGISVTTGAADNLLAQLVPDGSGGAFVIWEQHANPDRFDTNLFAQRISAAGSPIWTTPVTITLALGEQFDAEATPDGSGGFIVAWADLRDAGDQNLYAQRLSASGVALWATDGVPVSSNPAVQGIGPIVADGHGGVFVAWYDYRSTGYLADAYLMRLTTSGDRAWPNDLPVVAALDLAEGPTDLIQDGSGGVILVAAASDASGVPGTDVLAQRVDAAGVFLWGAQPVNVTPWAEQQDFAVAVPDGRGGAYLAWVDKFSDPPGYDIMAQHLSEQGVPQWAGHGVAAVALSGVQDNARVISDGAQGLIVAWQDYRNDPDNPDLFAQRISDLHQLIFPLMRKHSGQAQGHANEEK